jgi:hypothetical protein
MYENAVWKSNELNAYVAKIEPLASEASWREDWQYVDGYKGNPIACAILMLRKETQIKAEKIQSLEKELAHYKERYNYVLIKAKEVTG